MEIGQLKCFLAVVRERSFTRAAAACHVTQPSLSYQIGRLEEELGEPLFVRKPRDVALTAAGQQLLDSANRIVAEQERVVARFRQREALMAGELSFGVIPTVAPFLLPRLFEPFRREHPAIRLQARENRTSALVQEVVAGDLEFAIVSDVEAALMKKYSLHLTQLFQERLMLAAPSTHPVCGRKRLKVADIDTSDLILLSEGNCLRTQTLRLCRAREDEGALVCEQMPTQLAMVAAGLGTAIVPEMAVGELAPAGVTYLRFADRAPTRLIGILKKRGRKLSPAAKKFLAPLGV